MPPIDQDLQQIAQARKQLQEANQQLYQAKLTIQKTKQPDNLASVKEELKASTEVYQQSRLNLQATIAALYSQLDHKHVAAEMKAGIPVLFLPVRMETRFVKTVTGEQELWLRIYPDDFHVQSHEPLLTANEQVAGKSYWLTLVKLNRENASNKETLKTEAWATLTQSMGVQRAIWIAKQTKPLNWTPDLVVADDALQFPESGETKTHSWTQAPQTNILPDKFVVHIYRNNAIIHSQVGEPVPDTVFLGPDPFQSEEAFNKNENTIELNESFAWITDFDKAVQQGLGMKIKVTTDFFINGQIEKIIVMGLLSSADAAAGKELVEQLIENHLYSRKGFSFVPQGSPTNNTEGSGSAYQKNDNYLPKGYYDGTPLYNLSTIPEAAGNQMARLLGLDGQLFNEINNAHMQEAFEASAMNKALYPATIGNFMEVLTAPVIKKGAQAALRHFFTSNVTATGPLSAIRIGDQPYSLLLTSDLSQWQESGRDLFSTGLVNVLRHLQAKWHAIARTKVAHVHKGGNPSELMLDILGLEAGSVTFAQRLGHLPDFSMATKNITTIEGEFVNKQANIYKQLENLGAASEASEGYPYITNLTFYEFLNSIALNRLIDGKAPAVDRFLEKWGNTGMNYIEWLATAKQLSSVQIHRFGVRPPRTILYLLLRHALLLELKKSAEDFYDKTNVPFKRGAYEKSLFNFNKEVKDLTTWEVLQGVPAAIDGTNLKINIAIGDHFLNLDRGHEDARNITEMREAMQVLAKLPTSKLHKYLADHIDLCSYRLDAWQTGLFNRRLQQTREREKEGIYIGAYGWVENLKIAQNQEVPVPQALTPANGQPVYKPNANAGFVQTPSLNHATAAGVLLAGYHNHATRQDPGVFAVNLSSERVRRAMFVYEGIQSNQALEALLGYQFERGLHDLTTANPATNLNQYILILREKFPITNASIPQQGTEAQETVPAYSVVNGLKLVEANPGLFAILVPNATHRELILKEKNRLEDTLDALNDLLVSETAYQATQGKTDRTAAVLNAMKNADLPPDLEIQKTPRSSHLTFTNRVTLHFNPQAPATAGNGWAATASPRSGMEPGLNQWLGQRIGNPATIVASVSMVDQQGVASNSTFISLTELNLQPIDLVYVAGTEIEVGAKELEPLIIDVYRTKVAVPPNSQVKISFDPASVTAGQRGVARVLPLIRLLRSLITTGRPASAKDFAPRPKTGIDNIDQQYGWNIPDLINRVNVTFGNLKAAHEKINTKAPNESLPVGEDNLETMKELFELYFKQGRSIELIEKTSLSAAAITSLLDFLHQAALYGIKVSYPRQVNADLLQERTDLLRAAAVLWKSMDQKITLATKKLEQASTETELNKQINRLTEAAKAILGDDFVVFPLFAYSNPEDIAKTFQDKGDQLLKYINQLHGTTNELAMETWIESVSRVRPHMSRLEQIRMISEAQQDVETLFQAVQVPFKEKNSWLAVEFPAVDETTGERLDILDDTIALAIHGEQAGKVNEPQSALLIDEWTESIPNDKEITGISFNYDQPNATAPNALLLAVEPTGAERWNWDVLMGILQNTLERAKTRAVEPAQLMEDPALDTLLPMTVANFDLKEANISLDYLIASDKFSAFMASSTHELYKAWNA
jgi:hypothetical protein